MTETTFGARLLHAQDLLASIQNLQNYSAPVAEQNSANFAAFLEVVKETNATQSGSKQLYQAAVKARDEAFNGKNSLRTMLPNIRAAIFAQYGKNSQQYAATSSLINKIQFRKAKNPALPSSPSTSGSTETPSNGSNSTTSISTSQQSYGSLLGNFNALIETLTQMSDYAPVNPALTITNLRLFSQQLENLNNAAAVRLQSLQQQQDARTNLYTGLRVRTQQIKANIKSQFGQNSSEYKNVKGLSA